MSSSYQLSQIWMSKFGHDYTNRKFENHHTECELRQNFWKQLIKLTSDARSYTEVGCNAGMNLECLHNADSDLSLIGIEPNSFALEKAKQISQERYSVYEGDIFDIPRRFQSDLAFTCTVLIHVSPDDLFKAMTNLYNISSKYTLIMEYYWPEVKEIEYRGMLNALWKQDYGALYLKHFNVKILETGYLDHRDGFDRVTWWLFDKL